MSSENVKLTVDDFGVVKDHVSGEEKTVKRFTWTNEETQATVQVRRLLKSLPIVIDYGSRWLKFTFILSFFFSRFTETVDFVRCNDNEL